MNLFSFIKSNVSILQVIGEYTQLKKAGTYWKGCCPFHNEKTASFTVSPHKEIFYCFGCHMGGDVISFIASVEHCSQIEAVQHLIERYSISVPDELMQQTEKNVDEKKLYEKLCTLVAQWCHQHLMQSPAALHYLLKRGFTKQIMQQFQIGLFPGGLGSIKELMQTMQKNHILPRDLVEAGIITEGKTVYYSAFEDRIMFPIKDHLGRVCGFGGRIFKPNDERPKYYNSRENHYFNKGSILFGLDRAKKEMQAKGHAYLVEGYTDCVAMAQHGFANTVATLGTACTQEHLKTLSRYVQQLYVLYDSDRAGKEAMIRLTSMCWQFSIELKVISLPNGEDPASFLGNGGDLQALKEHAKDIFIFFIETVGEGFTSKPLSEKLALTRKLLGIVHTIQDDLTKDMLLQRASKVLDMPFDTLKKELTRLDAAPSKTTMQEEKTEKKPAVEEKAVSLDHKLERRLFFAIMNNIQVFNKDNGEFLIEYLPKDLSVILMKLKKAQETSPSMDFIQFFDILDSCEKQFVSKLLLEFEGEPEASAFDQLLLLFHKKNWKAIVLGIKGQLARAKREGNGAEEHRILNQFLELKKKLLA